MLKKIKQIIVLPIIILTLTACVSSQNLNSQAALGYTKTVNEANQEGILDTTSETSKRVHKVFYKMLPYADAENQTGVPFDWQINVIKSDELNAWALPGGKMMFYSGLVDKLQLSDDEIAVVMGHEMAHALKEHGKQRATVSSIGNVITTVAAFGLATQGYNQEGVGYALGLGQEFGLNRPFSRTNETEADEVGLFLMAKSGYNPSVAPGLWEKMNKVGGGSDSALAGLLSTHPTDSARQQNLQRIMPEALALYRPKN